MVALRGRDEAGPRLLVDRVETPLGPMLLIAEGGSLRALEFGDDEDRLLRDVRRQEGAAVGFVPADDPAGLSSRLRAYFAGEIEIFDDVPVRAGGTPFQRVVWAALRGIPPGQTTSYGQLAARLGRPGASRAVGLANGANPVAIAVPCHRVIGADGTLTGYGGGLERKRWLLEHERACLAAAGRSTSLL
jgi:methylated-DNA-[protein]-cysteine S-methyltransferase